MIINNKNIDIEEIANKLIENAKDMDFMDYEETEEETRKQVENALYYIGACAQNEYNANYFRILIDVLDAQI